MTAPTLRDMAPTVLPAEWHKAGVLDLGGIPGYRWRSAKRPLSVIMSVENRGPGGLWWHVSTAHQRRNPTWDEIVEIKETFMGRECCVMHMIPPRSMWIDCGTNTFHLWHRLDGDTCPRELYTP